MTMNMSTRKAGWWYPWIFVGMFGVVVAVNVTLAYFATSTFNGLQTEGAYEKGLAFNQALAAVEAQEKLGWTVEPTVDPAAIAGGGAVTVTITDKSGKPVDGLDVLVKLIRPTVAGHDSVLTLGGLGGGRYAADVRLPFPGVWDVQVLAARGDDQYRTAQRVVLK